MFVVKVESTNHLFWTVQSSRSVLSCLLIWFFVFVLLSCLMMLSRVIGCDCVCFVCIFSDETEVVEHVKDPFAPVLYLRINKWHTEPKDL